MPTESGGKALVEERTKIDRQKPVQRCKSTNDVARPLNEMGNTEAPMARAKSLIFPSSIKTVDKATLVRGPEDAALSIGQTVHFRSHYFGNSEPRVAWLKNGVRVVSNEEGGRIFIKTCNGGSTLIVRDLQGEDSGKYEIVIENEVGKDGATASLRVEGPPDTPASRPFLGHIDPTTCSLTLSWYGSAFDGGSIVTGFVVEMSSWPITADSR